MAHSAYWQVHSGAAALLAQGVEAEHPRLHLEAAGGAEGAVISDQWENTRDEWRVSRGRLYTQYSALVTQGGRRLEGNISILTR